MFVYNDYVFVIIDKYIISEYYGCVMGFSFGKYFVFFCFVYFNIKGDLGIKIRMIWNVFGF